VIIGSHDALPKRGSANKKLSLVLGESRIKLAARLVAHLDKRQYQLPVAGLDEELGEIPVVLFSILGLGWPQVVPTLIQ